MISSIWAGGRNVHCSQGVIWAAAGRPKPRTGRASARMIGRRFLIMEDLRSDQAISVSLYLTYRRSPPPDRSATIGTSPAVLADELLEGAAFLGRGRVGGIAERREGRRDDIGRQSQDLAGRRRVEGGDPARAEAFFRGRQDDVGHDDRGIDL